jgi:hypothetical protein
MSLIFRFSGIETAPWGESAPCLVMALGMLGAAGITAAWALSALKAHA